jgi:hypothetical protein
MEIKGSQLSRDELTLLLATCEQRARDYYEPVLEQYRRATKHKSVVCDEPGCKAVEVILAAGPVYIFCNGMRMCYTQKPECPFPRGKDRRGYCDKHWDGKLFKPVHACPHHGGYDYYESVCWVCKDKAECDCVFE